MDKMKVTYEAMLGLAAEFVLDEAVLKFRTNQIYDDIDKALAAGDEDTFYRLAKQLNALKR
ncbi:IDEAL domain-containing protein [Paenibacillus arenilitoris]|uniref:IDEAL domain-containing protein n=1 Tax=Paenibacillus arenilitoris TaxID=2772299 RepID=A0A927CMR2_9BACL|nr:IDEAL domain-containing protein [Paenibacillus arenilitoris]MBD2869677.1 IDEAL domain-containing protein [Paenibacillus arenilitoris]